MRTPKHSSHQNEVNNLFVIDTNYAEALIIDILLIYQDLKNINFITPTGYSNLEDYVYQFYYKRKYLYETSLQNLAFPSKDYFRGFNNHNTEFSDEWIAESPPDGGGRMVVSKNNYERKLLLPGTFINQNKAIDINDVKQRIKIGIPDSELKLDKYVHFYGESINDELGENKNIIRFYFNFNPLAQLSVTSSSTSIEIFLQQFQKEFSETFFTEFNERKIPFHLKIANKLNKFYADNVVLYLERRYLIYVLDFLETHYSSFSRLLRKEVPMFTFPIKEGIGFAEGINPIFTEESFGTNRSAVIVKILREIKSQTDDEFKSEIKSLLNKFYRPNDLNLFLNKDSKFEYNIFDLPDITNNENPAIDKNSLLNTAVKIGYSICKEAFWDNKGRCNWIGFEDSKIYKPLTLTYLDGLCGIVLYLSEIFRISEISLFKRSGIGLLKTIFSKVTQFDKELQNRGFHNGSGGLIYAIQKAIICFKLDDNWQTQFNKEIIDKIVKDQKFDNEPYDVYGGTAGTLWGFLLMKQMLKTNFTYDNEVIILKDVFLKNQGLWKTDQYFNESIGKNHQFLVGLPHGVTGIAYVLGLYQKLYNSSEFLNIIDEAIEFEQTHRRYNDIWLAANSRNDNSAPAADWEKALCSIGYSQIALHKLGLNQYYFTNIDAIIRNLLEQSLEDLIRHISGGVLDFHIEYNSNSAIPLNFLNTLKPIIEEFNEGNLTLRGVNNDPTVPFYHTGLIGLAGFGMSILRLYDPKTVNSYILPS